MNNSAISADQQKFLNSRGITKNSAPDVTLDTAVRKNGIFTLPQASVKITEIYSQTALLTKIS